MTESEYLRYAEETVGQDTFQTGIMLVNEERRPMAYAQLADTSVAVTRDRDGKLVIEIDDQAAEDVYLSINGMLVSFDPGEHKDTDLPWNGIKMGDVL